ncbi:hypothetical protein Dsin_000905 [Dipteronia sinensis]|uniref:Disease resistance RPP13-like protein 1 n=1 Tax=Dipteronia sinensis TaxID=43782 RepID=A0AAE0B4J5_9ROSI|nr:hypothetical protein Dsin_000905 [Dipteronia sinensis]
MIEAMLIDAEEKQLTDEAVKMWLDDLQDLAYDADDILDEFSTQALRTKSNQQATTSKLNNIIPACFTGLTPSAFKFNFSMGSKIDNITRRLEELRLRTDVLRLKDIAGQRWSSTASWQRPPTSSLPTEPAVYGRDEDKVRILEMVLRIDEPSDANFGVIPIVGMGGIGKTTLAREVFNDETLKDFSPKAWVCVSDNFDVLKISKAILESITSSSCDLNELNAVQIQLKETINGKKFLFVFDDVWSQNYDLWETLKSPFMFGAVGSKVIVTTRHRQVASIMRPNGCYELDLLSDDDCRSVFVKHALEGRDNVTNEKLEVIYQKVVEKCKGLPLAARTLGGLLRSKQIEGEWMNILNNKIWDLP